jgi:hypothetical protein
MLGRAIKADNPGVETVGGVEKLAFGLHHDTRARHSTMPFASRAIASWRRVFLASA